MSAFERLDAWKVCHELVLALHRFIKSLPDSQQDDALICDVMRAAILATGKIARGRAPTIGGCFSGASTSPPATSASSATIS